MRAHIRCYAGDDGRLKISAARQGIATLAFPSISTGIFAYPIEQAAAIAVSSVRSQVQDSPAIQEVVFCCFSAGDLAVYEAALREAGE